MASYHCSIKKPLSRGKGDNLMGKAAYNARTQYRDPRTGELTRDFSDRGGLLESFVTYEPKCKAPDWYKTEHERMLQSAVAAETAKNAREGQEVVLGFVHELGLQKNKWMLNDFIREQFTRREIGRVVFVNIHEPNAQGDQRNTHAHVLLMPRAAGPEGWSEKKLPSLEPEDYERIRQQWAEKGAKELRKEAKTIRTAGDEDRAAALELEADRYAEGWRTLPKQRQAALERGDLAHAEALDREASKHRSPKSDAMERKGQETERGNAYRDTAENNQTITALKIELAEIQLAMRRAEREATAPAPAEPAREQEKEPDAIRMYRGIGNNVAEAQQGEAVFFSTDPARAATFGELHYVDVTADELAKFERPHSKRILEAEPIAKNDWRTADPAIIARLEPYTHRVEGAPEHLRGTAAEIWQAVHSSDSPKAIAAALDEKAIAFAKATMHEATRSRMDNEAAKREGKAAPVFRPNEIVAVDDRAYVHRFTEEKTGRDFLDMQKELRTLDTSHFQGIDPTRQIIQNRQHEKVSPALQFENAARQAAQPEAAPTMPEQLRGTNAAIWNAYNVRVWQREEERTTEKLMDMGNIKANISFAETVHVPVELKGNRDPLQFRAALDAQGIELARATKEEAERSQKEAQHWKAHGEKRPIYKEGEFVAVNKRGEVLKLTQYNTGQKREDVQKFLNKVEWKDLKGIDAAKEMMQTRATERQKERQATSEKWDVLRIKNARNIKSNHRSIEKGDQRPAAILKRGGKKAFTIGAAVLGKAADVLGDFLSGPPVPLTRQQVEILKEENQRHANAAAKEAAAVHRWQDYTDQHEQHTAKQDQQNRDAEIIAEQSKRLQRDRGEGRERER